MDTIISSKIVITRKEHRCEGCARKLPKLVPTNIVDGREARVHRMPPSENRWKDRSRTYKGIAEAMAKQWGVLDGN